jgi:UPF0755 protein
VALLVLLLALSVWAWQLEVQRPIRPLGSEPVAIVIEPGQNAASIARELYNLGCVRHPLIFRALVVERGVSGRIKAGNYALPPQSSLDDVLRRFVRGEIVRSDVVFPEGKNMAEMARLAFEQRGVSEQDFLRAASDPAPIRDLDPDAPNLEGYLFPDTYDLGPRPHDAARLVRRMVARFREIVAPHAQAIEASGLSLRAVVTLASLVELETARAAERPRIAAVFLNRLKKGMLLQTDPTVIYALRQTGHYDGNIRKGDLLIESPYNTYRYPGLPPGPIASPGLAAIEAVVHPAQTQDLYFVSRNDGTHQFSVTLRDHEAAVTRFQRRGRSRGADSGTTPGAM